MSRQDRIDRRRERQELRDELYIELKNNPELAKTKAGREKACQNVIERRRMAAGREGLDPDNVRRWLELLLEWFLKLAPLFIK